MNTYLVHVYYAGTMQEERYVDAVSAEAAIAQVRSELPHSIARFANVFC